MAVSTTSVLRPRGISAEKLGANRARVVVEPLERGYGHTLGNALRRVLLSSIPGAAITEVEKAGRYFLLGAVVVVPIWLVARVLGLMGGKDRSGPPR